MTVTARFSVARLASTARAEFLKIWASRIPLLILVALPLGTYLFVVELYNVEGMGDRIHGNALDALPILFFATWNVTAIMSFILLAFMTMLSFRVIAPQWVLMRYFSFALGELKNPFPMYADSPSIWVHALVEFYRVALVTPLPFVLAAVIYFRNRDIVE